MFAPKQLKMIDFLKIVIFGSHPVNRYKIVVWVGLPEPLSKVNRGDHFVDHIQRSRKNIELMPSRYGERFRVSQHRNIGLVGEVSVLSFKNLHQCLAILGGKRFLLFYLITAGFRHRKLPVKGTERLVARDVIEEEFGKLAGGRKRQVLTVHAESGVCPSQQPKNPQGSGCGFFGSEAINNALDA